MGEHVVPDEHVVTAEQDLGHDVGIVAVVFDVGLYSQVIKAVYLWHLLPSYGMESCSSIFVDDGISVLDEFKGDVSCGFHDMFFFGGQEETHEGHEGGFTTPYGPG